MTDVLPTPPGSSAQETAIGLLRESIAQLRNHPRDVRAGSLANRIHAYLARFPEHFVTEFIEHSAGKTTIRRVPLSDWPEWGVKAAQEMERADHPKRQVVPAPDWTRDDQATLDILQLVHEPGTLWAHNLDEASALSAIGAWSDDECQAVEMYCLAIHARASDNPGVALWPEPPVLRRTVAALGDGA